MMLYRLTNCQMVINYIATFFEKKWRKKLPANERSPKMLARSLKEVNSSRSLYNMFKILNRDSDSTFFRAFPHSHFRAAIFRTPE